MQALRSFRAARCAFRRFTADTGAGRQLVNWSEPWAGRPSCTPPARPLRRGVHQGPAEGPRQTRERSTGQISPNFALAAPYTFVAAETTRRAPPRCAAGRTHARRLSIARERGSPGTRAEPGPARGPNRLDTHRLGPSRANSYEFGHAARATSTSGRYQCLCGHPGRCTGRIGWGPVRELLRGPAAPRPDFAQVAHPVRGPRGLP
jgi:hypothetical protein